MRCSKLHQPQTCESAILFFFQFMHPTIFHSLRTFVVDYGYWAVALALLCENAGIPVPGESTLLLASFLAYSEHQLHLG